MPPRCARRFRDDGNTGPGMTVERGNDWGGVLERIKIEANKRDMPYQSLIKAWLAEQVNPDSDKQHR